MILRRKPPVTPSNVTKRWALRRLSDGLLRLAISHVSADDGCRLVLAERARQNPSMYATAVVEGKVVRFKLSLALARVHRKNHGQTLTEPQSVQLVEAKRRGRLLRHAKPYLESHP